jgi:hypothetical protein
LEGRAFIGKDMRMFLRATQEAPLRMLLLAKKIETLMNGTPDEYKSFDEKELRARIDYVRKQSSEEAFSLLAKGLSGDNVEDALRLTEELRQSKSKPLGDALIELMKKGDEEISKRATNMLVQMHDKELEPAFTKLAYDKNLSADVRADATLALAGLHGTDPQENLKYLLELGKAGSPLREAVGNALVRYGLDGEDVIDFLRKPGGGASVSEILRFNLENGTAPEQKIALAQFAKSHEPADSQYLREWAIGHTADEDVAFTAFSVGVRGQANGWQEELKLVGPYAEPGQPGNDLARRFIRSMTWNHRGNDIPREERAYVSVMDALVSAHPVVIKEAVDGLDALPAVANKQAWLQEIVDATRSSGDFDAKEMEEILLAEAKRTHPEMVEALKPTPAGIAAAHVETAPVGFRAMPNDAMAGTLAPPIASVTVNRVVDSALLPEVPRALNPESIPSEARLESGLRGAARTLGPAILLTTTIGILARHQAEMQAQKPEQSPTFAGH